MGYTTRFDGHFKFSRQLTLDEKVNLDEISKTRHEEEGLPGYYCQWVSDKYGYYLEWDGGEKFYDYVEWLIWLIENFFETRKIVLNGEVEWHGEDNEDIGKIIVSNNAVLTKKAKIIFTDPEIVYED